MKQSAYERAKDVGIADRAETYAVGYTPELMCAANGCPNRWSIGSTHLCSAHHWAKPIEWPAITEQEQWEDTERILARQRKAAR